ncbi:tRNA (adenosine(37)-N6)-threonylcarbamoyltransferase complex dimerization subunit type 1 TsaB [Calidifontimicrobium sp. SYSU G02091]|uniref:tRNA (adenosine(37)-N6)-threonylcarbamoyltransferase complex dimerization subunit type 1 TsaB n=1 Tax=Calidifontimicrobium sp. SYSU G02091 TaxID=2926421 RepID=UPI001F52CFC4|nr:tRNA (adenosine(37)-N6)-threonylcarbamoyltransferase complex dimerization subunit type 1 TsaB [Calidifontimicrobium sp. SYSU G02091]MCI1190662.1 tRNA (adenosine(37)-N6)-threonylcarbamoyltransferase complex dimerization subunit type 1 TsaB [Calidifontimicrobium sp. SYSU G02091]
MAARLVAIDTSTERMVLAVGTADRVVTRDEAGAARTSARLLPALHELLAEAGLALAEVDAIAFARGPGAFTGLRAACAVAQGLALGLGRPVLPLDSLLVVADAARAQGAGDDVAVAMDARMDEIYAGRYVHDGARWRLRQPPALWALPPLVDAWQREPPAAVAGSALNVFGDRLMLPPCVVQWPEPGDCGAALMRLAQTAWRDGGGVDPADALPLYLRDKVALTTAERAAAAAR